MTVFHVKLNQEQIEYANQITSIIRNVRYNGVPLGMKGDITITGLMKKGFLMILEIYRKNIFANDSVVQRFDELNNDILSGFIAFRAKYLDMSVDEQLDNFAKMGIIRKFQNNAKSNNEDKKLSTIL